MGGSQDVRGSGAVLTTNAVINVNVGFQPTVVKLLNRNKVIEGEWWGGMPGDAMLRGAGGSNPAYLTRSRITPIDDGKNIGFKIGPDSQLNPTGSDELFWLAIRGNDPT